MNRNLNSQPDYAGETSNIKRFDSNARPRLSSRFKLGFGLAAALGLASCASEPTVTCRRSDGAPCAPAEGGIDAGGQDYASPVEAGQPDRIMEDLAPDAARTETLPLDAVDRTESQPDLGFLGCVAGGVDDDDGDGICVPDDRCPDMEDPVDERGYLIDPDGDGLGACDLCPVTRGANQDRDHDLRGDECDICADDYDPSPNPLMSAPDFDADSVPDGCDCNPWLSNVHQAIDEGLIHIPAAPEEPDRLDNNCNGQVDEGFECIPRDEVACNGTGDSSCFTGRQPCLDSGTWSATCEDLSPPAGYGESCPEPARGECASSDTRMECHGVDLRCSALDLVSSPRCDQGPLADFDCNVTPDIYQRFPLAGTPDTSRLGDPCHTASGTYGRAVCAANGKQVKCEPPDTSRDGGVIPDASRRDMSGVDTGPLDRGAVDRDFTPDDGLSDRRAVDLPIDRRTVDSVDDARLDFGSGPDRISDVPGDATLPPRDAEMDRFPDTLPRRGDARNDRLNDLSGDTTGIGEEPLGCEPFCSIHATRKRLSLWGLILSAAAFAARRRRRPKEELR